MTPSSWRLLVLATHPIQYRAPLFRYLANQPWLDLEVWYGHDYGVKPQRSAWGLEDFAWDVNLLDGYRNRFLPNVSPRPATSHPFGVVTRGLERELRRARPSAVWVSGYGVLFQWQAFAAAWATNTPVLYSSDSNALADAPGLKRRAKHVVLERLYRRLAGFLVSGAKNEEHFSQYGVPERKMFRVPWAIDNDYFREVSDRELPRRNEIRASWGTGQRGVVLFAGRLSPEKNPGALIAAVRQHENLHLVYAGSGPLQAELEACARRELPGRTTFLGFVPQSQLPGVYAAADILVLPSNYEPWGLVANEALACGCPVAASTVAGAAHDLVPPELRFDPHDPAQLNRALLAWRGIRDREPDMRAWARRCLAGFDYEHDAEGLHTALATVSPHTSR